MLLSTAAVGLTAISAPASAGEVEKSATFGGHVNRVVGVVDNGDTTKLLSGDNGASMSRVRFDGKAVSESLTARAYIEVRARGNRSSSHNATAANGNTLSMRHSYVSLSNSMGTLILGETNPSGDLQGALGEGFSGANWWGVDGDTINPLDSGFIVESSGNNTGSEEGALTEVNPAITLSSGRGGVIRYDAPSMNGFSFSTSLKGGADAAEEWSASIGYDADYDGTKVSVGYGYTNLSGQSATRDDFHTVGAAIELASGINANVGYVKATNPIASGGAGSTTGNEPTTWLAGLGYDSMMNDMGETGIGITYTQTDDALAVGDDAEWYGLNVSQNLDAYGASVYGGVSQGSYGRTGTNYEDVQAGWVGVRVTF